MRGMDSRPQHEGKFGKRDNEMRLSQEDINDFIELQLSIWPMAKANHDAMVRSRRRPFRLGDLRGAWQCNPARIASTGAKTDRASIQARPCFLCGANRPKEQLALPIEPGWEMLLNPFPIFPVHFTIAATSHVPQAASPPEMLSIAEKLPGMGVFFNGSKAGASAPDHLHLQAVLRSELPLLELLLDRHPSSRPGILGNDELGLDLPFGVRSALITPDAAGMAVAARMLSEKEGKVNLFAFLGDDGMMRMARIGRSAHRPDFYGTGEGEMLVSPGAIDMAGIIILPREEDFNRIDEALTREIYRQTGLA